MRPYERNGMAKLTISEAARVVGVARSTLHRAIQKGRISLDPDGRLDTAELLRCGYTLQGFAQQGPATVRQDATPHQSVAQQASIPTSELLIEALQRERDLLQQQLDATRELLQSERDAGREREREAQRREQVAQQREALLLQMLHEER
jgi:excisionase family DNA binding protein